MTPKVSETRGGGSRPLLNNVQKEAAFFSWLLPLLGQEEHLRLAGRESSLGFAGIRWMSLVEGKILQQLKCQYIYPKQVTNSPSNSFRILHVFHWYYSVKLPAWEAASTAVANVENVPNWELFRKHMICKHNKLKFHISVNVVIQELAGGIEWNDNHNNAQTCIGCMFCDDACSTIP